MKENDSKGDKMIKNNSYFIRIFFININRLDFSNDSHSLLQLCSSFKDQGIDVICLTEINVNWDKYHRIQKFKNILIDTWLKKKIAFFTSTCANKWKKNINLEKLQ